MNGIGLILFRDTLYTNTRLRCMGEKQFFQQKEQLKNYGVAWNSFHSTVTWLDGFHKTKRKRDTHEH